MELLIKGKVVVNTILPIPVGTHVFNSFFKNFDLVLEQLSASFQGCFLLTNLIHDNIFFQFGVVF